MDEARAYDLIQHLNQYVSIITISQDASVFNNLENTRNVPNTIEVQERNTSLFVDGEERLNINKHRGNNNQYQHYLMNTPAEQQLNMSLQSAKGVSKPY